MHSTFKSKNQGLLRPILPWYFEVNIPVHLIYNIQPNNNPTTTQIIEKQHQPTKQQLEMS